MPSEDAVPEAPATPAAGLRYNPIAGAKYDQPPFHGQRRFYMIAESPRSGSQLLADLLWRTGRMGAPGEYFNLDWTVPTLSGRLGSGPFDTPDGKQAYLRAVIRHRTTPNGVFGAKAHFDQLRPFLADEATRALLRRSRFVWLRRRDLLAQAISFVAALRTGQWRLLRGGDVQELNAVYSRSLLQRAMGTIASDERNWQIAFERNRIEPLEVWYEDLVADPDPVCRGICGLVGVTDAPPFRLSDSALEKQVDPLKEHWRRRYAAELDWTSLPRPARRAGGP